MGYQFCRFSSLLVWKDLFLKRSKKLKNFLFSHERNCIKRASYPWLRRLLVKWEPQLRPNSKWGCLNSVAFNLESVTQMSTCTWEMWDGQRGRWKIKKKPFLLHCWKNRNRKRWERDGRSRPIWQLLHWLILEPQTSFSPHKISFESLLSSSPQQVLKHISTLPQITIHQPLFSFLYI